MFTSPLKKKIEEVPQNQTKHPLQRLRPSHTVLPSHQLTRPPDSELSRSTARPVAASTRPKDLTLEPKGARSRELLEQRFAEPLGRLTGASTAGPLDR